MKVEIKISEESIETIIKYVKEHPQEIRGLIQYLGDEAFDVLMSRRVLKKAADLYRAFNGEVNYKYEVEERKRG
jgi:hypothetical protein